MSDPQLLKKLRLLPGMKALILNPPDGYLDRLHPAPDGAVLHIDAQEDKYDFVQIFAQDSETLSPLATVALSHLAQETVLWACYPKISAGVQTDLTRDVGWQVFTQVGFGGVASVSIDDTWSGVRFRPQPTEEEWLADQYKGKKAGLLPIYEAVSTAAQGLGPDVTCNIRKSYVAFLRGTQFALLKPSTSKRADLGLKLPAPPASERLVEAPGFGSGSITHKVALTAVDQFDDEIMTWLRQAYEGVGT